MNRNQVRIAYCLLFHLETKYLSKLCKIRKLDASAHHTHVLRWHRQTIKAYLFPREFDTIFTQLITNTITPQLIQLTHNG